MPPSSLEAHRTHFEALFRSDDDPWGYDYVWTEEAKRRAVGAALGSQRVDRLLEIGCGNGASTMSLKRRSHAIDAIDGASVAVELARARTVRLHGCRVWQAEVPRELPPGPYDAIVATEILYYLPRSMLLQSLRRVKGALAPGGQLVVTASIRPFSDRDVSNVDLFEMTRQVFGPPDRRITGGPWRLAVHRKPGRTTNDRGVWVRE